MALSVVTGLEVKHPRIKAAEQTILTLIGAKVMYPDKSEVLDKQIGLLRLGISEVERDSIYHEHLAKLIRQARKVLDEILPH